MDSHGSVLVSYEVVVVGDDVMMMVAILSHYLVQLIPFRGSVLCMSSIISSMSSISSSVRAEV